MKTFISAVLVTFMSISTAIASDYIWQSGTDGEAAYAFVPSERFKQTTLAVFVEKSRDCNLRLAVMTELGPNQDPDEIYVGDISARMKIDRNTIWTNEKANTFQGHNQERVFFDTLTMLDGKLLGEMLQGNSMIVQVGSQATDKFSLMGFTKAVNKAVEICESIPSEWDNAPTDYDEWSS